MFLDSERRLALQPEARRNLRQVGLCVEAAGKTLQLHRRRSYPLPLNSLLRRRPTAAPRTFCGRPTLLERRCPTHSVMRRLLPAGRPRRTVWMRGRQWKRRCLLWGLQRRNRTVAHDQLLQAEERASAVGALLSQLLCPLPKRRSHSPCLRLPLSPSPSLQQATPPPRFNASSNVLSCNSRSSCSSNN